MQDYTESIGTRKKYQKHDEKTVKNVFGRSKRRVQVYLAANGQRSVQEIGELLRMKAPNVSSELKTLQNERNENIELRQENADLTQDKKRLNNLLEEKDNLQLSLHQ